MPEDLEFQLWKAHQQPVEQQPVECSLVAEDRCNNCKQRGCRGSCKRFNHCAVCGFRWLVIEPDDQHHQCSHFSHYQLDGD